MNSFLRVEGIWKSFQLGGRTLEILRDVNFEVGKDEMVAITGPSGIGKTTLLHILGTIDIPDKGEIYYGDVPLSLLSGKALADFRNSQIGFVFQFFQLLPEFTALENVIMPMLIASHSRGKAVEAACEILAEVGLADRLNHYPSQLSGGEQQRAAIARALVRQPRLLLADEPTGNLDVRTGANVFALLRELQQKRGLSSIIVTHNPEISGMCDRILAMEMLGVST